MHPTTVTLPRAPYAASPTAGLVASGAYTSLALALNVAMGANAQAQARYLAIYGVQWAPLPCGAPATNSTAPTTTATTVVA